jgi:Tfp pilus assembly protein PilO
MGEKKLNPITLIVSIIAVVLLILNGILWYAKGKADKSAAEYKAAYEELLNEKEQAEQAVNDMEKQSAQYEANMREVVNLMLDGAVVTENCANLMQSVWNNCIFQIRNSETDKYTLNSSGGFYKDFNDALGNL